MGEQSIVLGGGCFWCVEAVFQSLPGVISVTSGYAGGTVPDPDYESVCSGRTGHAEVVRVVFDPEKISMESLLDGFWASHDPTTLNRQGADVGSQYRSIVLYEGQEEKGVVEASRDRAAELFDGPIVTEIAALERFYPAEDYHQDYYRTRGNAPYCQFVIQPKLEKLRAVGKLPLD